MSEYLRRVRSFNRSTILYLAAWGFIAFAYFGILSVLFSLYLLRLGYTPRVIGLLVGSGQLIWALAALPAAALGTRLGLRRAILAGMCGMAAFTALLLLVEQLPPPLWTAWLAATWVLLWASAAAVTVNSIPYQAAIATEAERPYSFGVRQSVLAGGTLLGGVAAGVLVARAAAWLGAGAANPTPYRMTLWLAPIAYLLAVACMAGAADAPAAPLGPPAPQAGRSPSPTSTLVTFAVVVILGAAAEGTVRAFFTLYLDQELQIAPATIGALVGAGATLATVMALSAPLLLTRYGPRRTYALCLGGAALCLGLLALVPRPAAAALGYGALLSAIGVLASARNLFSQELIPPRRGPQAAAAVTIGVALGWSGMAALGGYVVEAVGYGALFACGAGLALLALAVLTLFAQRVAPVEQAATQL
jgi:MFS family permease